MLISLFILILACIVLVRSGGLLVKSLTNISAFFGIPEFTVSFILMAFATSIPELFLGITSAIHQDAILSFGNVIGANIINITLVLGLTAVFVKKLKVESIIAKRRAFYALIVAISPLFLVYDGKLSRFDGVLLLCIWIFSLYQTWRQKKRFKAIYNHYPGFKVFKDFLYFILGVSLLLGSAEVIVQVAEKISWSLHIPMVIIGLALLALGTTLPELTFSLKASKTRHEEMVFGNVFGSIVLNATLILGLVSLISPIRLERDSSYYLPAFFTILSAIFLLIFLRSKERLHRHEGIILIAVALLYIYSVIHLTVKIL